MTLAQSVHQINQAMPSKPLSALMVLIGVIFIFVGIYSHSNILKATMIAYAIVP